VATGEVTNSGIKRGIALYNSAGPRRLVSGLVSEKKGCSENRFQTFGPMETIEVTL